MATPASDPDAQHIPPSSEAESNLSSLVYDLSQRVQMTMENMLKTIAEVDQNSAGITKEIAKCKDGALEREKMLEEEKEKFQKAAYTVLGMLNDAYQL